MSKITPCLWVEDDLQEIFDYYKSIFPNVQLESMNKMPDGSTITAIFEIEGQRFMALHGGPMFKFTEAVSFYVRAKTRGRPTTIGIDSRPTAARRASVAG